MSTLGERGSRAMRNVRLLYVFNTVLYFQPHVAIWVVYLTGFRELSLAQVGMMEAFFWAVKIVLEVPSGAFSDRFGRRLTFAAGVAVEGVGVLLFALAGDFTWLLISYVLWSAGLAFRSGNDEAFMFDWLAAEGRQGEYGDRVGLYRALGTIAFGIGGVLGAMLAAATTLQIGVLAAVSLYVLAAPVVMLMGEPPRTKSATPASYGTTLRTAIRAFRRDPALRYAVLFEVLLTASFPAHFLLAQPFLVRHAIPLALFGVLEVPVRLSQALANTLAGRVKRRIGLRAVMLLALCGVGSGLLLLAAFDHVVAFAGFAVMTVALGLVFPVLSAYINERTDSAVRATVLSVSPLGTSIVFAIVAPFLGIVGDESLRLAFLGIALAIIGTAAPTYLAWLRADRRSDTTPEEIEVEVV